MPDAADILEHLHSAAAAWRWLAVAWHAAALAALAALALGARPGRRTAGLLLALPLLSVSLVAFLHGNPFNGAVFAAGAAVLASAALRLDARPAGPGPAWSFVAGAALIAFGWAYPHFLGSGPWYAHLYAAPLGVVPCPTLAAVLGFALLLDGLGSRLWSAPLALLALLYGLVGVVRLGVRLDAALLAGAAALILRLAARERRELEAPQDAGARTQTAPPAKEEP